MWWPFTYPFSLLKKTTLVGSRIVCLSVCLSFFGLKLSIVEPVLTSTSPDNVAGAHSKLLKKKKKKKRKKKKKKKKKRETMFRL